MEVGFEGEEGGELESVESFDGGFAVVGCGGGGGGEVGPGGEEAEDVVGAGGDEAGGGDSGGEVLLDGDGAGVGEAGAEEGAEVLGGVVVGGGECEEGLVGEEVGAGCAVDFGGGVGEVFELAGVVPNTNAGMAG